MSCIHCTFKNHNKRKTHTKRKGPAKKRPKTRARPVARKKTAGRSRRTGPIAFVGKALGGMVDKFIGTGDYKVHSNSVLRPSSVPAMHSTSTNTIVRHREYILDILSSTAPFQLDSWTINPGNDLLFPWLSTVAANYECYKFRGLVFEYRSLSGDVTTQMNQGYIAAAIDYNSAAVTPTSKSMIENMMGSQSARPDEDMFIPVECKPQMNPLGEYFVRTGALQPGQNVQFYDYGLLQLALGAHPANNVTMGELWVTYEIELCKPTVDNAAIATGGYSAHLAFNPASTTTPIGNAVITSYTYNNIAASWTPTSLSLPAGLPNKVVFMLSYKGTSVTMSYPALTITNGVLVTDWYSGTASNGPPSGTVTSAFVWLFTIQPTNPAVPLTINFGTAAIIPISTLDVYISGIWEYGAKKPIDRLEMKGVRKSRPEPPLDAKSAERPDTPRPRDPRDEKTRDRDPLREDKLRSAESDDEWSEASRPAGRRPSRK